MNWDSGLEPMNSLMAATTGRMLISALGSDLAGLLVLQGHALTDDALHTGEADAELVLQQLAHAADAAVAQVVDLVGGADAMIKTQQVVDGCKDIIHRDGAG